MPTKKHPFPKRIILHEEKVGGDDPYDDSYLAIDDIHGVGLEANCSRLEAVYELKSVHHVTLRAEIKNIEMKGK